MRSIYSRPIRSRRCPHRSEQPNRLSPPHRLHSEASEVVRTVQVRQPSDVSNRPGQATGRTFVSAGWVRTTPAATTDARIILIHEKGASTAADSWSAATVVNGRILRSRRGGGSHFQCLLTPPFVCLSRLFLIQVQRRGRKLDLIGDQLQEHKSPRATSHTAGQNMPSAHADTTFSASLGVSAAQEAIPGYQAGIQCSDSARRGERSGKKVGPCVVPRLRPEPAFR